MTYTIHELAELAGITPRTLRHYDRLGLLKPSGRTRGGYRLYGHDELLRLQQILFFRELEFSLKNIKDIMAAPDFNRLSSLEEQKRLLEARRRRLGKLVSTITNTINYMSKNTSITDEELYDAFKDDDIKQYQAEAQERWGNTDAYKQSQARVSKMTKAEMEKLKEDGRRHTQAIANAMDKGVAHPDVQALIAKSHQGVNFFYDCSIEMFRNLGKMYVNDLRFAAYYEKFRPGLAQFMRDAIEYYCDHEKPAIM